MNLRDIVRYITAPTLSFHLNFFDPDPFRAALPAAFSPDSKFLASYANIGAVKIWEVARRREMASAQISYNHSIHFIFKPDGQLLAYSITNHTIEIWDVLEQKRLASYSVSNNSVKPEFDDPIYKIAFNPVKKIIVILHSRSTMMKLFDMETFEELEPIETKPDSIGNLVFSPNGQLLAGWDGNTNTIRLWDTDSFIEEANIQADNFSSHKVANVLFTPDSKALILATKTGWVKFWDVANQQEVGVPFQTGITGSRVALSANGKLLAWNSEYVQGYWPAGGIIPYPKQAAFISLFNLEERRELSRFKSLGDVATMFFSPDGKYLAIGTVGSDSIKLWKISRYSRR